MTEGGTGWFITKSYNTFNEYFEEVSMLGQSFTPTLSGNLHTLSLSFSIAERFDNPDHQVVRVEVYSGSDLTASPVLLASEKFTVTSGEFSWYDIAFTSAPAVTAGEDYVIVCQYDDACEATGFNQVEWQRGGDYTEYPRSWGDDGFECDYTPAWTGGSNNNRYLNKLWIK